MTNPRALAWNVLQRLHARRNVSGVHKLKADQLLHETVAQHPELSSPDRSLLHALVMGVLRQNFRLDAWIQHLTGRPLKAIEPKVRLLLKLGLLQLAEFSQVPDYAAIDTTVALARQHRCSPKTIGFINGVLREAQRRLASPDGFSVPEIQHDLAGHLLAAYGWPTAWVNALQPHYTPDVLVAMAQASQQPAPLTLRVNTLQISPEQFHHALDAQQIPFRPHDTLPDVVQLTAATGSPRHLPGYEAGWFYVQDPASIGIAPWLGVQPGERVLDLCAAPGSKTTHMAALMQNRGHITAIEAKPERAQRLQENLTRLGITNTEVRVLDARTFEAPTIGTYDRVLVDAPCSGSGTVRRHPELLLHPTQWQAEHHTALQLTLLQHGFQHLKPGGVLVYSTCSILPAENQSLVQQFLQQEPHAHLDAEWPRPITPQADGFYSARLLKQTD